MSSIAANTRSKSTSTLKIANRCWDRWAPISLNTIQSKHHQSAMEVPVRSPRGKSRLDLCHNLEWWIALDPAGQIIAHRVGLPKNQASGMSSTAVHQPKPKTQTNRLGCRAQGWPGSRAPGPSAWMPGTKQCQCPG